MKKMELSAEQEKKLNDLLLKSVASMRKGIYEIPPGKSIDEAVWIPNKTGKLSKKDEQLLKKNGY